MTILATLKENIICPDGEEYRAIWGEYGKTETKDFEDWIKVGKISLPLRMTTALIECERPTAESGGTKTKDGVIGGKQQTIKHIYYSE